MTERNENNEQIASSNLMADQEVPVQQEFASSKRLWVMMKSKKCILLVLDGVLGLFSRSIGYPEA